MSVTRASLPASPEESFTLAPTALAVRPAEAGDEAPAGSARPAGTPASAATYRLLHQFAQGGIGEVWEAVQTSLGRIIAIKRLRRDRSAGLPAVEAEFQSESVIAASLEHPNILPVYDLSRDETGALLLAMKRIHGTPWRDQLKAEFAATPSDTFLAKHIPILLAVTQAVAFAHSRGIIHRDIKPAQVLVGEFGEVLLTDWGLAIRLNEFADKELSHAWHSIATPATATNPAGTPSLMAPEQTEPHAGNLGPWTDVYLLGGTLYYLLTGTYPHAGATSVAALEQAKAGRIQLPSQRAPDRAVPTELEQLCLQALEPDRARRLSSATNFFQGLQDYLSGAARKEQSAALTAQVEKDLATAAGDYERFNTAISSLDEARRLWPDNPTVAPLRQQALHGSARLALARGDLSFARLQCDALPNNREAKALHRDIERREREVARRRTLLRVTVAAVFALLLVIAGGSLLFSRKMQAANKEIARRAEEAERALAIAQTRGKGAFDLINFVLQDLKTAMEEELTPARGITESTRNAIANAITGKVATPIVKYFGETKPESWPVAMQAEHAKDMDAVGTYFEDSSRFEEARKLFEPALAIQERIAPDSLEVAALLINLADNHDQTSHHVEAESLYRRALALAETKLGPDAPLLGRWLMLYGSSLMQLHRLPEAEAMERRAIPILEKSHDHLFSQALSVLTNILNQQGLLEEAVAIGRQALAATDKPGAKALDLGLALNNLALPLRKLKRYDEAQPLLERAYGLWEREFGPDNARPNIVLLNLAQIKMGRGDLAAAEPMLRRALANLEKALGPANFFTVLTKRLLAEVLTKRGQDAEAEAILRQDLAAAREAFGANHLYVAQIGFALAQLDLKAGRDEEARDLLRDVPDTYAKNFGPQDPQTVAAKQALADAEAKLAAPKAPVPESK
ncbi:MAG: serine/threonine-protein kinase [Lacunisphaera sp.]